MHPVIDGDRRIFGRRSSTRSREDWRTIARHDRENEPR
jgi:hypothetical protein